MATNIKLTPPVSNAYLSEVVPFYTNNTTLNLLMLWNVGDGSSDAPLQVLQYSTTTNSFIDVTSSIFVGAVPIPANPRNVTVADFNGDGNPSFIIANQGLDQSPWPGATDTLVLSTSSGQLINASVNLPQSLAYSHDLSSGVIDKAGDIGVYINNIYSQPNTAPYFLISNSNGTFTNDSAGFLPTSLQSTYPAYTSSALVDLTGNGLADLIIGAEDLTHGPSLVYLNPGNGNFSHVTPIALPASPLSATTGLYSSTFSGPTILDIEPIHISSPNYDDLVVVSTNGNYEGYAIQILINDGTGHFTDQTATRLLGTPSDAVYASTTTQPWVERSIIVDLNGHGADIVTQSVNGAPSQVFLNDGSGHFNLAMSLTTGVSIMAVATIAGVPTLIESNGTLVPYQTPPVVNAQTADQVWMTGQTVSFTMPSNTFTDPSGQQLTYTASELNGAPLPGWLSFNASTETFSGTVPAGAQSFTATITATDTNGWLAEDNFYVSTALPVTQEIAGLYVTLYGLAATQTGITYWTNVVSAFDPSITAANAGSTAISGADEVYLGQQMTAGSPVVNGTTYFQTVYPSTMTDQAYVQALYQNMSGFIGTTAGDQYWLNVLQQAEAANGGNVTLAREAIVGQFTHDFYGNNLTVGAAALGVSASDYALLVAGQQTLRNKATVAQYWATETGVSGGAILNFTSVTDPSFAAAQHVLAGITSDPNTVTAAILGINNAVAHQNLLLV